MPSSVRFTFDLLDGGPGGSNVTQTLCMLRPEGLDLDGLTAGEQQQPSFDGVGTRTNKVSEQRDDLSHIVCLPACLPASQSAAPCLSGGKLKLHTQLSLAVRRDHLAGQFPVSFLSTTSNTSASLGCRGCRQMRPPLSWLSQSTSKASGRHLLESGSPARSRSFIADCGQGPSSS